MPDGPDGPDDLVVGSTSRGTAPCPVLGSRGNGVVCGRGGRPMCSPRDTSRFEVHRPLTD